MADIQHIKHNIQAKSPKFRTPGSGNRMVVSEFIPEVQKQPFLCMRSKILLKIAENKTKFSTFEIIYANSTSKRTTAVRHFGRR